MSYGYGSTSQVQANYNGAMPFRQSYGYSGYQVYPANSRPNVAMYGAAGLVGGVAVGAGSYYAYDSMYNSLAHRRRRITAVTWCFVPSTAGSMAGKVMACNVCQYRYGYCSSTDKCYSGGGCGYTIPKAVSRDDLATTGFIPQDYKPPLRVIILNVTSPDITPTAVCPPTTEADLALAERYNMSMTFSADLFVTLTQQSFIGTVAASISVAPHLCPLQWFLALALTVALI